MLKYPPDPVHPNGWVQPFYVSTAHMTPVAMNNVNIMVGAYVPLSTHYSYDSQHKMFVLFFKRLISRRCVRISC